MEIQLYKLAWEAAVDAHRAVSRYTYYDIQNEGYPKHVVYLAWLKDCIRSLQDLIKAITSLPDSFNYPGKTLLKQNLMYSRRVFEINEYKDTDVSRRIIAELRQYLIVDTLSSFYHIFLQRYHQLRKIKNESERLGIN